MVQEGVQENPKLSSPEEELSFLRERVIEKERELESLKTKTEQEYVIKKEIDEYKKRPAQKVLNEGYALEEKDIEGIVLNIEPEEHDKQMEELIGILQEKGIRNVMSVVDKMKNPHIEDDFHRILVQYIKEGLPVLGLKEKESLWKVLHTTLYEVSLPQKHEKDMGNKGFKELISLMEQFYAGMFSVSRGKNEKNHFTLEIAVRDGSEEIVFYASVPDNKKDVFEKQVLSLFPDARVEEQKNDYNIFVEGGVSRGSVGIFAKNAIFPLKTYEQFDEDPLNVILNTFSNIGKTGSGAALQIVFKPVGDLYTNKYKIALASVQKGTPLDEALDIAITPGEKTLKAIGGIFSAFGSSVKDKKESEINPTPAPDQLVVESIQNKIAHPVLETNVRIIASAQNKERAEEILHSIESAFYQFENTRGNKLQFKSLEKGELSQMLKNFSFRDFSTQYILPLNTRELTTMMHFPAAGVKSSSQVKQSKANTASAPLNIPQEGTLLGINRHRNVETKIYLTKEDRLRHLYVIGQTGTGKTVLLKNMIAQDILQGEGVCMIDPHGTDIVDILSIIPEDRFDDVIYFDPGYTDRAMALNMLEYDERYPEQKTFVVNELFSIFQKLYGDNPEAMGPIFEQYFRNATLLVLEDPSSGSTLLDISRVLADERFRNLKLSRAKNPVVIQFWRDIATKAEGEQSLANIVPYITSKFDIFIANDIMRPIIAQQKSSINFREIMDEKKILLVNLAKGRLGDINSSLIGLIVVGKILMAALSRVDAVGDVPPFYLYIDEFQNITTDSISTILSEARKYKLSLNVAHQFIAQLDDKTKDAVFGNVGSIAAFRIGADDAEFLQKQFEPVFNTNDLMNIDNWNAYVKLLINGKTTEPFSIETIQFPKGDKEKIEKLKQLSYQKYGRDRAEIEKEIQEKYKYI